METTDINDGVYYYTNAIYDLNKRVFTLPHKLKKNKNKKQNLLPFITY